MRRLRIPYGWPKSKPDVPLPEFEQRKPSTTVSTKFKGISSGMIGLTEVQIVGPTTCVNKTEVFVAISDISTLRPKGADKQGRPLVHTEVVLKSGGVVYVKQSPAEIMKKMANAF